MFPVFKPLFALIQLGAFLFFHSAVPRMMYLYGWHQGQDVVSENGYKWMEDKASRSHIKRIKCVCDTNTYIPCERLPMNFHANIYMDTHICMVCICAIYTYMLRMLEHTASLLKAHVKCMTSRGMVPCLPLCPARSSTDLGHTRWVGPNSAESDLGDIQSNPISLNTEQCPWDITETENTRKQLPRPIMKGKNLPLLPMSGPSLFCFFWIFWGNVQVEMTGNKSLLYLEIAPSAFNDCVDFLYMDVPLFICLCWQISGFPGCNYCVLAIWLLLTSPLSLYGCACLYAHVQLLSTASFWIAKQWYLSLFLSIFFLNLPCMCNVYRREIWH